MKNTKNRKIVIVYTKQFPFGFREAYLLDEVPVIKESFDEVYFYPYAEFIFNPIENRISKETSINIVNLREINVPNHLFHKIKQAFRPLQFALYEVFCSRQKFKGVLRFKQNFLRLFHFASEAKKLDQFVSSLDGQVIHYHYWFHDGLVIAALSKKVIHHEHYARGHSIDIYHKDWPLGGYLPFEKIKLHLVRKLFSVSKHGLKYLNDHFPQLSHKFHYSPLGISINEPNKIKLPQPKIVTISFLGEVKNLERMIELMTLLKRKFIWVHIGSGTKEKEQELIESCASKKINLEFLGYKCKDEINAYLSTNQMAFFANTSKWEGVPVSMMEAGIYGIPFIATDIPGNLEIVNEDNGFIIPLKGGQLDDIANEIIACYEDQNSWMKKARCAQETILSQYNAHSNLTSFFKKIKTTS